MSIARYILQSDKQGQREGGMCMMTLFCKDDCQKKIQSDENITTAYGF